MISSTESLYAIAVSKRVTLSKINISEAGSEREVISFQRA
jgi:hypothetical protein